MPTRKLLAPEKNKIAFKYFAPAIGWGIFILVASVLPGSRVPSVLLDTNDKLIHASIYFVAAILIYFAFIRYSWVNPISREAWWFIVMSCILFGGMLEMIQNYMVPSRAGDWLDFWANTLGSVSGATGMHLLHRLKA